jgi:mRNA interferase MazF
MTKVKRGSVILVEVVFSSGFGAKLRPALVISTSDYNKNRGEVIVAAITSNTKQLQAGDTVISEWEKAGLKVPSLATAILQTVKKDRIQKCLGQIDELDFVRIEKNIAAVIGFSITGKAK